MCDASGMLYVDDVVPTSELLGLFVLFDPKKAPFVMTSTKKNCIFSQKAKLSLNFIIVGGGIAGLACAFTLQCAGHKVRVFDKSDGKREVGFL